MRSRKRISIAVLCLLSATIVAMSLKGRPAAVHAAAPAAHLTRAMSTQPIAHLSNAELRAAVVRNVMMLDGDAAPTRVSGNMSDNRPVLPQVEEFTLTPPNPAQGVNQTTLSVRFPAAQAANLAERIPLTLGRQKVVLQRSSDDPNSFVASLNFDWQTFAREQQRRSEAASQGKMVPVFSGRRFIRLERMQFVDPAQIQDAVESHQPVQFTGGVLLGSPDVPVFPDHQLMMTALPVVQAQNFTFDRCAASPGTQNAPWTFSALMFAIAGATSTTPQPAEQMLLGMLNSWNQTQSVNSFPVPPRPKMGVLNGLNGQGGSGLLANWPIDASAGTSCSINGQPSTCPSLILAPVRLDAIVNRLDLGANGSPFPAAGELRFIFSVTTDTTPGDGPCHQGGPFNIILEYNVPSGFDAQSWANKWFGLQGLTDQGTFSTNYLNSLKALTDLVVLPNRCDGGSCISQIRTNEILLASGENGVFWEQREFHFSNASGQPVISEGTIAQTPDPRFNTSGHPICSSVNKPDPQHNGPCVSGSVSSYINVFANNPTFQETEGAAPPVPLNWTVSGANGAFLGGAALNDGTAFWNDSGIAAGNELDRVFFSVNTCNGCHGAEAATAFQQVTARTAGGTSNLANFLPGCLNNSPNNPDDTCTPPSPGNQNPQCSMQTQNLGEGGPTGQCMETVPDPNRGAGPANSFGDIARRVMYFQQACQNQTCSAGGGDQLLLPFMNKPIGVH